MIFCSCLSIYLYIYIYIVFCHLQIDCFIVSQLFSVTRHTRRFKLRSKSAQLYVKPSILPLGQQSTYVSSEITMHYVSTFACFTFCLTGYQSAQFIRRVLHYASAQPPDGGRIYCHPQTDCFIVSVWLDMQDASSWDRIYIYINL